MKIVSTNISKIKTVLHRGKEVQTGIFKTPTTDEVRIETLNIVGDEQSDIINHGGGHKAVYAFSAHHYDYWKGVLEKSDLPHGSFGENFTLINLHEEEVRVGDQLRFGTALLEVSQPRVPCYKLGIAFHNKDMVKLFTEHYCTGVYFRVLEPGVAQTGGSVSFEKRVTHNVSIKSLFQAYFDKTYVDSNSMFEAAMACEALAPEWREMLDKKLSKRLSV